MSLPRLSPLALLAFLALAVLAAPAVASGNDEASFAVEVIVADRNGQGIDGELGALSDRLRSQFPQFSRFRRSATHAFSVAEGDAHRFSVPSGSQFELTYLGEESEGVRVRIAVRGGASTVVLPRGGMIFVGGPSAGDGTLIFAILARP